MLAYVRFQKSSKKTSQNKHCDNTYFTTIRIEFVEWYELP